jgi:hypothetical protein
MKIHMGLLGFAETSVKYPLTLRNIHEDRKDQGSPIYIPTVWLFLWIQNSEFQDGSCWYFFHLNLLKPSGNFTYDQV